MKKTFSTPEVQVLLLQEQDVISTSLNFVNIGSGSPKDNDDLIVDLTK